MPAYGFNTSASPYRDLELPSGSLVQVKVLGVDDMISMGLLEQFDSLGALVQTEHVDRVKGTAKKTDRPKKKPTKAEAAAQEEAENSAAAMQLMGSPESWNNMQILIDRVVVQACVKPKVSLAYNADTIMAEGLAPKTKYTAHTDADVEGRNPDSVWTDTIEFADRMAIFSECLPDGEKMASFRKGSKKAVGNVGGKSKPDLSAE